MTSTPLAGSPPSRRKRSAAVERRTAPRETEVEVESDELDKRVILQCLNALRRGDFGVRLPGHLTGIDSKIADAFNEVADLNQRLGEELERVAKVVGKEGRIAQRVSIGEARGSWGQAMSSINDLIGDLGHPTSEMARVIGAVARGDLKQSMALNNDGRPLEGEFLRTAQIVNTMVDQLAAFSAEVTRVAREVGTEGKLGGQAKVKGVAGTWKDLTDSVNQMAGNLTSQVRNIAQVTTAVASGNLSKKITVDVRGEFSELKDTINTMVDQLNSFASEVTRVAREVGTEGKLGGQADVRGVGGTWKDLTDSVNSMAGNLTSQMRNIVDVTKAVANGDLSKKITADAKGEILELKNTINVMVDQLNSFASEVTRVANEVGTDGKLGGQADVRGVAGTWKDLTNSVNSMAGNLTAQVRNVATVTTAVANGDLSKKITVDVRGEMLELKNTINTMVDQLSSFAAEVTRVAREVGTEGKLGGQAQVKGVGGVWKDLTDNVNFMAGNLTSQVRNIAAVTTAVANGDLSKKITVDVRGEMLQMKDTINVMVDQLNSFAAEVTRVAREVGTEGKLGGQADVRGVGGVWKDLTDSVNSMAGNLTAQVRNIAAVTTAVAYGDLSKKITVDVRGEMMELKDTINTMVDQLRSFASEVTRVAREVGTDGKLGGQAMVRDVGGVWKELTDNVNFMAGNLTSQVRNIAAVTTAVANGDLSKKITVDVRGEVLELKNTINVMVDQLNSFSGEVTRVARDVGTEGKLGGQADVRGVAGVWKDLTDNVNVMAGNLTNQVRGIARVVTAIANGDLKQKFSVEAKGEMAAVTGTINSMIDTLATFADQVTTVAREVGVEGKLGGQASVPGSAGTWKDLTDNVNRLASNLTTQVRAIGEVATAVTTGDLTRSIKVDAQGELLALKDNINEMIRNLKDTTIKTNEQDWLKTNLAKFSRMLQGQKDMLTVGKLILSELAPVVGAQQGVFYIVEPPVDGRENTLRLLASYAYKTRDSDNVLKLGEGLVGQCALEKEKILLQNVPHDYVTVSSGLGEALPTNIIVLPVLFESNVKAVIELASFERFNVTHLSFLDQLTESIGIVINTIEANMRTEDLLKQSQSLARELQSQQMELQSTNTQLEEKAALLADQNSEVERKNAEVEQARQALEEKATQLALTSKYKSEFLANMSHELRTPLNSLLILSDHLSKNVDGNLTPRQMEFLTTIHGAGADLLSLINDILDLSKIESGTVVVDVGEVSLADLTDYVDRSFRHIADGKKLAFNLERSTGAPRAIHTDAKRLQQVLKNLLSNAFKFTSDGAVTFSMQEATSGWHSDNEVLEKARSVIAFRVRDTGIGIPLEKQQIIFEAFQQADGSTSRKYGGTGLGLAISRELAGLLGGELSLVSTPGAGSEFTLYLPAQFAQSPARRKTQETVVRDHQQLRETPALAVEPQVEEGTESDVVLGDEDETGDKRLLVIENEAAFASFLRDVAREKGFKTRHATRGALGVALAHDAPPDAITLDINLPDMDGWRVLERLKSDPKTRHIPVQVISTEDDLTRGVRLGAHGVLAKPVQERSQLDTVLEALKGATEESQRHVLVVGASSQAVQEQLSAAIPSASLAISTSSADEAMDIIRSRRPHFVVLTGIRDDGNDLDLIARLQGETATADTPVIVYLENALSRRGEAALKRLKENAVVREAQSPERLLDNVVLYAHVKHAALSDATRKVIDATRSSRTILAEKTVLVVDDDVRNIFALGTVLEPQNMKVLAAENGRQAIDILQRERDVDAVLMDIMMPEMDGYDTMRAIRRIGRLRALPIIALTAKAMKGDREKCLEAGASDYVSKPVDTEQLLGVLRAWLYR